MRVVVVARVPNAVVDLVHIHGDLSADGNLTLQDFLTECPVVDGGGFGRAPPIPSSPLTLPLLLRDRVAAEVLALLEPRATTLGRGSTLSAFGRSRGILRLLLLGIRGDLGRLLSRAFAGLQCLFNDLVSDVGDLLLGDVGRRFCEDLTGLPG